MTLIHTTSLEGLIGKTAKISFKNQATSIKGTIRQTKKNFYVQEKGKKKRTPLVLEDILLVQKLT